MKRSFGKVKMNILFLGDVVAKSGREAVIQNLESLKSEYSADFIIINAENAAHGKGITPVIYKQLSAAGADVITLGNHSFSKREIIPVIDECENMIRPSNMEPLALGSSVIVKEVCDKKVAVVNLLGLAFMNYSTCHPVEVMQELIKKIQADIIIVDLHAEATAEKALFVQYFKNDVTAVIGTHTHVQTADEQIKNGCAFISDVGMCGVYDSVLGRDTQEVIDMVVHHKPTKYTPARGTVILCGCLIEVDEASGRATAIRRFQKFC